MITDIPEQAFKGTAPTPSLVVTSPDGKRLVEGVDYVVFYTIDASEVNDIAVVSNPESEFKTSISSPLLFPKVSVIDPRRQIGRASCRERV